MWLTIVLIFVGLLIFFLKRTYMYWKERGVTGPDPVLFFGNIGSALIGKKSMSELYCDIYRKYDGYPFIGFYRMFTPTLMIREPEMIKHVIVKDFKHFCNNDVPVDKDVDKLLGRNPFFLKDLEWKIKRAQLTPHFTSGKIKSMYPIIEEVSNQMIRYVEDKSTNGNAVHEAREVCVRYTLNNVAALAFGLDGRCLEEDYPMFRKLADDFLSPGTWQSVLTILAFVVPSFSSLFKAKFVKEEVENQLIHMVRETLEQRRKNKIVRNDFLEMTSALYNNPNDLENELEIVAQAASFFLDGYETSSRVMSFILFELASNTHCQEKLREEIIKYCEKSGGKLNYEIIQEMPYLDACVNESMRKNPVFGQLFKVCTEQYTYTCTDPAYKNSTVTIEPGTSIILPIAGLQTDEKFFESPEEYVPERFLSGQSEHKFSFLPFGEGPRACLGMRFGLAQIKLGVAQLIRNFELSVNDKTQLPLKYDKWFFVLCPIGGLWLDFKKIVQD